MAWTEVPIHCQLQENPEIVKIPEEREITEKETKIQKGTTPGHTSEGQGVAQSANKTRKRYNGEKEKGLHAPDRVPFIADKSTEGLSRRSVTEHETRQVQDQRIAVRTVPEMSHTDPSSQTMVAGGSNRSPGVVMGELQDTNPRWVILGSAGKFRWD